VNETWRGVTIFLAALVTIWLWAPLSSAASRTPSGVIVTETYFGPFRYLTLRTELKEPDYSMRKQFAPRGLASTMAASALLWGGVFWKVRRKPPGPEEPRAS
jgi:hypothetical protein